MMAMSFLYSMLICMKEFGMYTVATYWFSSVSMMHQSRTYLVATIGKISSSLDIKSLWLLLPASVLNSRVPSILSLSKRWDYEIVFLCSSIKFFLCRGMNVYLIWICFIYDWTANQTFLIHFLRPALSDIRVMMTAVTSSSLYNDTYMKNTLSYGYRTSCSAICAVAYA